MKLRIEVSKLRKMIDAYENNASGDRERFLDGLVYDIVKDYMSCGLVVKAIRYGSLDLSTEDKVYQFLGTHTSGEFPANSQEYHFLSLNEKNVAMYEAKLVRCAEVIGYLNLLNSRQRMVDIETSEVDFLFSGVL
jgi:hypothetical protein